MMEIGGRGGWHFIVLLGNNTYLDKARDRISIQCASHIDTVDN